MNFKRRICLRLKDHTPGRFQLWKEMENEIGCVFEAYGLVQSDIIYQGNTKTITIEYDSFEDYSEAVIDAAQQCATKGLLIEQISILDLKTKGIKCKNLISKYKERKYA